MPPDRRPLAPGSTIGIVGGGQLGRMAALAAARLGYCCHIFCPEADAPASQVSARTTLAPYEDEAALAAFAAAVDVVTFEFENIPAGSVRILSERTLVRPHWRALEVSQDRAVEKTFLNDIGIDTAPWRPVTTLQDLEAALGALGLPALLKTARLGYDGKGQVWIRDAKDAPKAFDAIGRVPAVLEGKVDFVRELSVVLARGADGAVACFDVVENRHKNNILDVTLAPAAISPARAEAARDMAARTAAALDLVGLLALELFETGDGRLLANEIAPRPHNSGHWTMDACATDQFEQFVRAVAGLPLGDPKRHSDATMTNLIGEDVLRWHEILGERGAHLHLYGKAEARPGRKMGHVNRTLPRSGEDGGKQG